MNVDKYITKNQVLNVASTSEIHTNASVVEPLSNKSDQIAVEEIMEPLSDKSDQIAFEEVVEPLSDKSDHKAVV